MKNYYELLAVDGAASADEVKCAFRHQIARYHPDKVQHLGKEFQDMAAERAAELTEAYRILSNGASRAEYDRLLASLAEAPSGATAPPGPAAAGAAAPSPGSATAGPDVPPTGRAFTEERTHRDEFVRKAALGRVQRALEHMLGDTFEQPSVRGFDLAIVPKPKLFGRSRDARLLVRFVSVVDAYAIGDAWTAAAKWAATHHEPVCVVLVGPSLAPASELASAIGEQRRRPARGAQVTLVPVDARDWAAHFPTDTPALARRVVEQLQKQH